MNHPIGTITFLFTDIEGSTSLWERCPDAMRLALARHDLLVREAIERHNGYVFKTVGDAFCAAFLTAPDALNAALEAQLALDAQEWSETGPIRVRMGLHTGEAEERDNDYFGQTLNRVARLQRVGHGQQILVSQATYELVKSHPPENTGLSDLGLHRLKDLAAPEHVWQLLHPSLPQQFPTMKSLEHLPNNLPLQVTSFIGREREMAEIKQRLQQTRLLALTGSGGCGKTRLALQVAADVLEDYREGVWLVELAPLADPALVAQTVAEALTIREAPGEPITRTLLSHLKERQMLLVLDNCEHLLEASARLVDTLIHGCANLRVLVSSREALGIAGESAYRVPSLSLPPLPPSPGPGPQHSAHSPAPHAGGGEGGASLLHKGGERGMTPESLLRYEAVRLFVERASAVKADFTVTQQSAGALVSICHRLDGIPLAIELAAARVRALPIEEINMRLDSRFHLLTGGSRTALHRQQTLRAMIDWSYDLLEENQQTLMCRLSVFAGGWTLEAAEFVCAEQGKREGGKEGKRTPDSLIPGGRDSLLSFPPSLFPSFPNEVLDFLTSLVDKSLVVYGEKEGKARYRLLETVRQYARDRLVERGEAEAVRERHRDYFLALADMAEPKLAGAEQIEWLQHLDKEYENLRAALNWSLSEDSGSSSGHRICGALQRFWWTRGYLSEGREWCERMLQKSDAQERTAERAKTLNGAGAMASDQGDYVSALSHYQESMAIKKEIGDRSGIANSLNNLGNVAYSQGDYASARAYHEESLEIRKETGDRLGTVYSLYNLGNVARSQGDYAAARSYYEGSLEIRREIGDRSGISYSLNGLGNVAFSQGDYSTARSYYEGSLEIRREIGDKSGIAHSLNNLGSVAYSQGDYVSARTCHEESLAIRKEIGDRSGIAYSLHNLGNMASAQGEYVSARAYYQESLDIGREIGNRSGIAETLTEFACLAARESKQEQAALLFGAAEGLREEIGLPLPPNAQEKYDREVAAVRQALGQEKFSTAWAEGRTMTMEQAILYTHGS